jgi:hypothetical protein
LAVIDDTFCASLWGILTHSHSFRPAVGTSGGLLIMWDSSVVEVWSSFSLDHVLIIHGRFIDSNDEFYLFTIYAPCGEFFDGASPKAGGEKHLFMR